MKLLLKKITWYLFPILILLLLIEILTRAIPNDYTFKRDYLNNNSNNIKVLFLGNSHAYYGVNPAYIDQNSFNAAYVSQSVNYDYQILEKYKDKWNNLKFVFIPLDYFTLYNRLEYGSESFRTKNYVNYYHFPTNDFFVKNLEICNGKISDNLIRIYRFYANKKKTGINRNDYPNLGWGGWAKSTIDIPTSGKLAALRQQLNSKNFLSQNLAELKRTIKFLKNKNIKLVLYTLPACKDYIQSFDTNQFEVIKNIGLNLAKNNSNVNFFDFLSDPSFSESDFHDGDHLCIEGAKKFSLKIDSILKIISPITN